jgi:hypothetical protein
MNTTIYSVLRGATSNMTFSSMQRSLARLARCSRDAVHDHGAALTIASINRTFLIHTCRLQQSLRAQSTQTRANIVEMTMLVSA